MFVVEYRELISFSVLHGMQTRSIAMTILSVRLSVRPSLKHVHCDNTEEISLQIFYTIRKII